MDNQYYVYILTNKNNTVLYIGVTNNLEKRVFEHRNSTNRTFCGRYNLEKLVYFESCGLALDVISREKQLKKWSRIKKIKLIESLNPDWIGLLA